MGNCQNLGEEERQLVLACLRDGLEKNDISKILGTFSGKSYSDDQLKTILEDINLNQAQKGHIHPHETQGQGQKGAADKVIDENRRQLPFRPASGSTSQRR